MFRGMRDRRFAGIALETVVSGPPGINANDGFECELRAGACREPVKQRNRRRTYGWAGECWRCRSVPGAAARPIDHPR
jgi:hypothetical protein